VTGRGAAALGLVAALAASGCAHGPRPAQAPRDGGAGPGVEAGLASYYADDLHGHPTASGRPYDRAAFTCAHRTWPFGTRLVVTEPVSGRRVVVTVTDRGPFVAGRIVDVSWAAARALGLIGRGVVRVLVRPAD
jgi:rare lipoprotein A